ncbi:MAG: bifunctional glutamate N-acetyltransferase/amino-acid acetyltransferase ArgJ, partial [Opitutales bacterium]
AADVRGKRDGRLDLGLIHSNRPCSAVGVFTTNDVKAAPVTYCMDLLAQPASIRAVVVNSGNANACTGAQGERDARLMATETARHLGLGTDEVLVCSTGRIGEKLPMTRITASIKDAAQDLAEGVEGGRSFLRSILTSDTRTKSCLVEVETETGTYRVAGAAKGAGMIEPNMATMLAFVTTDAQVDPPLLGELLRGVVEETFNKILVDGDMSTNDTVLLLANGFSGIQVPVDDERRVADFHDALTRVCRYLAEKIVSDGERITKVVEVKVEGARDEASAERVCRAIGNSLLVKTSWYGSDPNWGRLVAAAGYAKAELVFEKVDLFYDEVSALLKGEPQTRNREKWREIVGRDCFSIRLNLNQGNGSCQVLSSDLSEGYVDFNKSEATGDPNSSSGL